LRIKATISRLNPYRGSKTYCGWANLEILRLVLAQSDISYRKISGYITDVEQTDIDDFDLAVAQ
jgi:hypothetical protein